MAVNNVVVADKINIEDALNGGFDKLDLSSSEASSTSHESAKEIVPLPHVDETIREMFDNWKLNIVNNPKSLEFNQDDLNPFAAAFEPYYLNVMNKSFFNENEGLNHDTVNLDDFKSMTIEDDK